MTDPYTTVHPYLTGADPATLIRFSDAAGAATYRQRMLDYIFKGAGLPTSYPQGYANGANWNWQAEYAGWTNLKRVDRFTCYSGYAGQQGFSSVADVLVPGGLDVDRLMIYHSGHENARNGDKFVQYFLARGFTVAVFNLPLFGKNNKPPLFVAGVANSYVVTDHDKMLTLNCATYSPLQAWVEPVARVINNMLAARSYQDVSMFGYSGGGYMSTLYPALDLRVDNSFPVAGTLPHHLKTLEPNDGNSTYGDWEQNDPKLFSQVRMLEMYVLGASTAGRRQKQILNIHDDCCFAGVNARSYEAAVASLASLLGGSWSLMLDDSVWHHTISDAALAAIAADLGV